jgi:hypothetical protein
LLPWVQKNYIHSELKSNAAVLQYILYVYDRSIVWETKERTSTIKSCYRLFPQSHMTSDRTLLV